MYAIYQVCICDDEALHRDKLKTILLTYSFASNREFWVDECEVPQQLFEAKQNYDIIFLDIDFPGEDPGTLAAKELRQAGVQSIIIFLTSYPQYALEGYEAEAFRYILKPVTLESITEVMDAVYAKWERTNIFVSVKTPGGTALLDTSHIQMIATEGRKQKIYSDSSIVETWEPLKEIFQKLEGGFFAYAHQGCVVNLAQVQQIQGNDVILPGNTKVTLSRRQKKSFILGISKMLEQDK